VVAVKVAVSRLRAVKAVDKVVNKAVDVKDSKVVNVKDSKAVNVKDSKAVNVKDSKAAARVAKASEAVRPAAKTCSYGAIR
jgi:hypothetical protein